MSERGKRVSKKKRVDAALSWVVNNAGPERE